MLSCFPFSYSPLKDDDYAQLFIGPHDQIGEEANDNCLHIDLSVAHSEPTEESDVNRASTLPSTPLSRSPSTVRDNHNIKLPLPLPRTFRKPDTSFSLDSCQTIDSTTISTPVSHNSTKLNKLKLGFSRSKGTEHLQQESLRKSNDSASIALHSQRYIKLPTSLSRLAQCSDNKKASKNSANISNSRHIKANQETGQVSSLKVSVPSAPSCSLASQSPKPPRPLTSHPGIAGIAGITGSTTTSSTTSAMPRQKVQWAAGNCNDTNADNHIETSARTGDTCLTTASTSVSMLASTASSTAASTPASTPASTAASNCESNSTSSSAFNSVSSRGAGSSSMATLDWNKGGSFINKPPRGWLHPDHQIAESGVSYAVRYVGCLGINTSMKSLDFDTRSQIAKECINRVCESGGLKTADKKRRLEKRINRMLAETSNMDSAGANVNLTITSSYLNLIVLETEEVIARHEMPNISFASGGDADTLDFVAYVAKDHRHGRACFVLECGGGLAQDVITTIGQAFELRFKEFLKRTPRNITVNERLDNTLQNGLNENSIKNNNTSGIEDREYYNDLPGKIPPDAPNDTVESKGLLKDSCLQRVFPQAAPRSCLKRPILTNSEQSSPNLIDLITDMQENSIIDSTEKDTKPQEITRLDHEYVNCTSSESHANDVSSDSRSELPIKDPFDMQPFNSALAQATSSSLEGSANAHALQLEEQVWYHGLISRKDSEMLVVRDGDFLVRESQGSKGQYVLTGMQGGVRKHLLLVDPQGVVRTKDKTFESVSHLINYHRNNGLPIISAESALVLRNPVLVKR